jgi:hypothetical protein
VNQPFVLEERLFPRKNFAFFGCYGVAMSFDNREPEPENGLRLRASMGFDWPYIFSASASRLNNSSHSCWRS